jgi:hypothetical protein
MLKHRKSGWDRSMKRRAVRKGELYGCRALHH